MYNFNSTSLSTPPLLGVGMDFGSNTPRTPEILNSLIAMTNPFEYSYASAISTSQAAAIPLSSDVSPVIACKSEDFFSPQFDNNSQSNCSSTSSLESPGATPLHMAATISSTPSLQQVSNRERMNNAFLSRCTSSFSGRFDVVSEYEAHTQPQARSFRVDSRLRAETLINHKGFSTRCALRLTHIVQFLPSASFAQRDH
jgi:hypothetical protein